MIPPEPDPPTPTVLEYTYSSSSPVTLGAVTGILYKDIQQNGVDCKLTSQDDDYIESYYPDIILYEVDGTKYCYFTYGTSSIIGILGNNAEIGLTVTTYRIYNGSVSTYSSEYLKSSTPSDYFENIRTRNFTLVQRS